MVGSLLLAWQVKDKPALVVGGGEVAKSRIEHLQRAEAKITVIADSFDSDVRSISNIQLIERKFQTSDLDSQPWDLVLTAIDDREVSAHIYSACRERKIPVNCADIPDKCNFYFGSMINRGPLQVMISTNGEAPRLAKRIREVLEETVDELQVENAILNMGKLRQLVRQKTTDADSGSGYDKATIRKRMRWVSEICDGMTFQQMAQLTDNDIEEIVVQYA
jgi:precorrin-2 dehydrogenase / sirohydrochlorin ferrochelatase